MRGSRPCPGPSDTYYDTEWLHTSIGADSDGNVTITYQSSRNDCNAYAIRKDGGSWSEPPYEIDQDLYGYAPYGRMHQSGYFMVTFTDRDYFNPSNGTNLPYFVAWK